MSKPLCGSTSIQGAEAGAGPWLRHTDPRGPAQRPPEEQADRNGGDHTFATSMPRG